jgi:very-short-patch-repair endonuclease
MSHSDGKSEPSARIFHLSALAGRQFGLVTYEQLVGLGFSRFEIRSLVNRGLLHRMHHNVFAFGHPRVVSHARLLAAQLTCGGSSFLSHRTAAAIWGLRPLNVHRIEVTVPGTYALSRPGLVVHHSVCVAEDEVRIRNGLRVSSVARLLVESAKTETLKGLDGLITEAVRHHVLDLNAVEHGLVRHARRPGMAKLKQALRDYRPHPDRKSGLERAFDELIRDTDIPPPQRNVYIDGWEVDCFWPEFNLVVELDGRNYHASLRDMEKDKFKDAKLALLGIQVIRITELRFELEPAQILADLVKLTRRGQRVASSGQRSAGSLTT